MRFKWDKKYLYWGITAFIVICCSILFYYLLFHGVRLQSAIRKVVRILMPFVYGFAIAYILAPVVNMLEGKILEPIRHKICRKPVGIKTPKRIRVIAILITEILALLTIYGLFAMLIPQITKSIQSIVFQSSSYLKNITGWINDMTIKYPLLKDYIDVSNLDLNAESIVDWLNQNVDIDKYMSNIGGYFSVFFSGAYGFFRQLFNFVIGIIISVYLLNSKELFAGQAKKIVYAVTEKHTGNRFIKNMRFVHKTFIGFISGKAVDSLIIGMLCFIGTTILQIPYPILVSVIVGVTNVIPFFGPYLGAVPCALFILVISPIHCLYFIIFIIILQQFDGNILGPKILGDSTGLSSIWVIFAITFFGGLWGVLGMFVAVPVFAVIFAILKTIFERMLKKRNMPTATSDYIKVKEINKDMEFVELDPNETIGRRKNKIKQHGFFVTLFLKIKKQLCKCIRNMKNRNKNSNDNRKNDEKTMNAHKDNNDNNDK